MNQTSFEPKRMHPMGNSNYIEPVDLKTDFKNPEPEQKVAKEIEPKYKEPEIRYIEKEVRRGNGCGLRIFFYLGCLGFCFLIFAGIYILTTKPVGAWEKIVEFLNDDVQVNYTKSLPNYDTVKVSVDDQLNTKGQNEIKITEDQLTVLGRENISQLKNLTVDVESEVVRLYWTIDENNKENPLWGVVEIKILEGKPEIKKIGTERVGLPSFLNEALTNGILAMLDFGNNEKNPNEIIRALITKNEEMEISEIRLEKDLLVIVVNVDVSIF